jgi:hypothetical protein
MSKNHDQKLQEIEYRANKNYLKCKKNIKIWLDSKYNKYGENSNS